MDKFDLYRDIATRTGGDIYVGVQQSSNSLWKNSSSAV